MEHIATMQQGAKGRTQRPSKANKNIGIKRSISPLRDQHASDGRGTGMHNASTRPAYPPSKKHSVETSGNRYGK